MRLRPTLLVLTLGAAASLAFSGCGTSAKASVPPGKGPLPSGSVAAGSGLPAVAHATDLEAAPKVEPGPGGAKNALVTRDLVVGTGKVATSTGAVRVQYIGALYPTGKVFDATWSRGAQAVTFSLSEVVAGFAQGITGMKVGGRREMVIPPYLGYGPDAKGAIPGNSTLVFVVDLLGVG